MKKFKIIRVKQYQVIQPDNIVVTTRWEKDRDITSDQASKLRVSPTGIVQRLHVGIQLPLFDLMQGIEFKATWERDDNYRVIWWGDLEQQNGDPWKMFVKRHMRRKKQSPVKMGQTI